MFKSVILASLTLCCSQLVAPIVIAESIPDPTRPLDYGGAVIVTPSTVELQSILVSGNRKIAVINGERLMEKQWINGKQVLKITRDRVWVNDNGHTIVLRLYSKTVRQ